MNSSAARRTGLASIVIPCRGGLASTRACVSALFRHTRAPWELIAVDGGSAGGTADYLAGVRDAAAVRVEISASPQARGLAAAFNVGLHAARGDYLVLLDSDAVVTDAWLDQLTALAEADPSIGLAGPMTNHGPPPQLVEDVPYRDLDGMHGFAGRRRNEQRGRWMTVERLSGFCLLLKRRAYEVLGGLDERFRLDYFDDDLALRARGAGFQLALAHDLFVHRQGLRPFAAGAGEAEALLEGDRARFAARWGLRPEAVRPASLQPWTPTARATPERARVSLTMIVRDEEANLPGCLESARGLFDEVVVVDTGSSDRTREIAASFDALVSDFAWIDDFSAARNAALERAGGDYAFWLDADDRIEPEQRRRLEALLEGLDRDDPCAYVVRCACDPGPDGSGGRTVVDHIRLFPLRPDVRWTYRVHEQIMPALRRAGVPVRWSDVQVRHTGYVDPPQRRRKLMRDRRILEAELADRPGDPFVLFNLGSIAVDFEDWPVALDWLERSLAGSAPDDSITGKLHALIARARQNLGDAEGALAACAAGLETNPDDAELLFREAVVRFGIGDHAGAESCWRRILTLRRPERFGSVDEGIYGHLTLRNLAVLAEARGDLSEAARLWGGVLAACPGDAPARAARERLGAGIADF